MPWAALGSTVVSFERCAGDGLRVAEFYESDAHWTGVLGAHVDASGFGFCCGGHDVFDGFA